MREIKFRAWVTRYDEPEMLYLKPNMTWRDVENGLTLAFTEDGGDYGYAEVMQENLNYPIMQFTGLHDKNGKEIYEGDVLTDGSLCDDAGNVTKYSIGFRDGAFRIETTNCTCGCIGTVVEGAMESEVIGNIYENPELLTNN